MSTVVQDNTSDSRFEIHVDGVLAGYVDYREHEGEYALPHTRILSQFEGRGLGTALIVGALDEIRARGGAVLPYCPFVPKVMRDHPEYVDLVPQGVRDRFGL